MLVVISFPLASTTSAADDITLQYILYIDEIDQLLVSSSPIHICNLWVKPISGNDAQKNGIYLLSVSKPYNLPTIHNNNILYYDCRFDSNYTSITGGTSSNFQSQKLYPFIIYNLDYNTSDLCDSSRYSINSSDYDFSTFTIYTNVEWNIDEISLVKSYNPMSDLNYNLTNEKVNEIISQFGGSKNYPGISGSTSDELVDESVDLFDRFIGGELSTSFTLQQLNEILQKLIELQQSGDLSIPDLIKINNAIEYNQSLIMQVLQQSEFDYWNLRDISPSVSSDSQQSDKSEIEYVNSIDSGSTIADIAPSKILNQQSRSGGIQEFLTIIWDNSLIKLILPVVAGFVVISVVLGRKFKL